MNKLPMNLSIRLLLSGLVISIALSTQTCAADDVFPGKTIKCISPFIPGSVTDTVARILADRLKGAFGVPIVVENRPGASTILGTEYVVNAAPDGNTWVLTTSTLPPLKSLPQLNSSLRFDPVTDLAHVGLVCRSFNFLVVPTTLPVNNVREFVDLAKSHPGKLTYGHAGLGSSPHLGFELFKHFSGIDVLPFPTKPRYSLCRISCGGRFPP